MFGDSNQNGRRREWRKCWCTELVKRIYARRKQEREVSFLLKIDFSIRSQKTVPQDVDTGPEHRVCLLEMLKLFDCFLNPEHKA